MSANNDELSRDCDIFSIRSISKLSIEKSMSPFQKLMNENLHGNAGRGGFSIFLQQMKSDDGYSAFTDEQKPGANSFDSDEIGSLED